MKKIIIIDDEIEMLESFKKILSRKQDYKLELFNDTQAALERVENGEYDLVITDLKMDGISGMDILKSAKEKRPDINVVMVSGYGTIQSGVEAAKLGAFDFIEKPFTSAKLYDVIEKALSPETSSKKNKEFFIPGIVSESAKMQEVVTIANKISSGNMTVLITGESGTGKEILARSIHKLSDRKENPFVPVNCGALPENLFESELFGHEKGAFTGALKTKPGLLEFANQGTFFFDEIGDMPLALQVKLLRMLEDKKIRRVGGQKEIEIDIRIIAATNQNLENLIEEKKFREDLYYRLNIMKIIIPPLRERREDIVPLANEFLSDAIRQNGGLKKQFSKDAEESLSLYDWPGNARELQNLVNRAFFLSDGKLIDSNDIPLPGKTKQFEISQDILNLSYKDAKHKVIEKFEEAYLMHYLKKNKGNISKAAEECGLDRRSIHRLINTYNIVYHD